MTHNHDEFEAYVKDSVVLVLLVIKIDSGWFLNSIIIVGVAKNFGDQR